MNCLIRVLSYAKQRDLINLVHNRDETFEQELISYKKLFCTVLNYCLQGGLIQKTETDKPFCETNGCYCSSICLQIHSVIKAIDISELEMFFNGIQYCYLRWIDSEASVALAAFEALLKEYDLIPDYSINNKGRHEDTADTPQNEVKNLIIQNLDKRVFFRARVTAEPNQYLGKMEMFHVPFNKRYNLRNERFSLTGQPILYLGNSIPGLLEEMGISSDDEEAMKCLRISSFEFTEPNMRIYDLRCNIEETLKHSENTFTKQDFFRNLLSFICSFQKRRELADSAFKEEYAIPQMLTQVLKKNNYHGICYYSTKPFHDYYIPEEMTNPIHGGRNLLYRENLAVFTNMGDRKGLEIYDMDLFDSLEISMPISIYTMCNHSANELEQLLLSIKKQKAHSSNAETVEYIKKRNEKAESIVKFYGDVFSKMTVNKISYGCTPMGRIHTQLLLGILNRLLVDIEHESNAELFPIKREEPAAIESNCMVEICDVEGNSLGEEDAAKVHEAGLLHLAEVVFVQREGDDGSRKIASWSKNWNAFFYHHTTTIDDEMRNKYFAPPTEKKKIGAFIHKEYKIGGQLVNEMGLQTNFEYVEVYLCDAQKDCSTASSFIPELCWKNREDLRSDFQKYYSSMDSVYQQALMILLSYLKKESE